ncbi:unnamed protein product, partial [Owenia fusiformis]
INNDTSAKSMEDKVEKQVCVNHEVEFQEETCLSSTPTSTPNDEIINTEEDILNATSKEVVCDTIGDINILQVTSKILENNEQRVERGCKSLGKPILSPGLDLENGV